MNSFACRFTALFLAAASLSACHKKPAVEPANADATAAADEPAVTSAPVADAAPSTDQPTTVAAREAAAVDPAVSDVPAELLASDRAYESWFKKYSLDLNDPTMLDADPDGDGATNRDEFMADTNPLDPNSRPGIHKVMRLKKYAEVRVPLVLQSVSGRTAKIRTTDGEEKVESLSVGDSIGGMKVEKVTERHAVIDKTGTPVDLSRVELENPTTKEKVVLVKDLTSKSAATSAVLTSADGTTMTVRQGEEFTWPSEKGATYKVIDLRADQVVVQEVVSKRMWTIPKE